MEPEKKTDRKRSVPIILRIFVALYPKRLYSQHFHEYGMTKKKCQQDYISKFPLFLDFKKDMEKVAKAAIKNCESSEAVLVFQIVLDQIKAKYMFGVHFFDEQAFYQSEKHEKIHDSILKVCEKYLTKGVPPYIIISTLEIFTTRCKFMAFCVDTNDNKDEALGVMYG